MLLQHREENIKVFLQGGTNCNQFLATSVKYKGRTWKHWSIFQVAIRFHPCRPLLSVINSSFWTLLGLLLTKLKHYFNDSMKKNTLFGYS